MNALQNAHRSWKIKHENLNTTKSMVVSKEPIRCKLAIDNHLIEQVSSFNYFGVLTSRDRNITKEVRTQANKAAIILGYLRDIIWKNKYISLQNKVRIYKASVRPILTYAAETRAKNSKTKKVARTTEMRTLRSIMGVTLIDRMRSADIREKCGVQDIVRWMRKRMECTCGAHEPR